MRYFGNQDKFKLLVCINILSITDDCPERTLSWVRPPKETDSFMPIAAKTNYFGDISLTKEIAGKYLNESCSLKLYLQLSFK